MLRKLIFSLIGMLIILSFASQGQSNPGSMSPADTVSDGNGGSHKQLEIEKIIKAVEQAKNQKPTRYEYLKDLLSKPPFTTIGYKQPTVWLRYERNNTTIARNTPIDISATVRNDNPIEIRRVLYLTLEVKNPNDEEFRAINKMPELIQTNEYSEEGNTSIRRWNILPDFSYLKDIGEVRVRIKAGDGGQKDWYTSDNGRDSPPDYRELHFNVTNNPPYLDNINITGPSPARYKDPIAYEAFAYDLDGDIINITLHVLDDKGTIKMNTTPQQVKSGSKVVFTSIDQSIFKETDGGRNFTYYYTYDDGISNSTTPIKDGPRLKSSPKLWVSSPRVLSEDRNNYWWQKYSFALDIQNQEMEPAVIDVTLFTDTSDHPGKVVGTQKVRITKDTLPVTFNATTPFEVTDANQSFRYWFEYSEYDQYGKLRMDGPMALTISPRIVKYDWTSWPFWLNVLLICLTALLAGIFFERRLS